MTKTNSSLTLAFFVCLLYIVMHVFLFGWILVHHIMSLLALPIKVSCINFMAAKHVNVHGSDELYHQLYYCADENNVYTERSLANKRLFFH